MLLVAAILLAIFVLPRGWGVVAIAVGLAIELAEAWFWYWLSRRRRPAVGMEAMIGTRAKVVTPCRPRGRVRVQGELWQAECEPGADPGDEVDIVGFEGLRLLVTPR